MLSFFLYFYRGTLAVHDLTVGDGCNLYLTPDGTSRGTDANSERGAGFFSFDSLTVEHGGYVAMSSTVSEADSQLNLVVSRQFIML